MTLVCRVCLEITEPPGTNVTSPYLETQSIQDSLLQCVPEMDLHVSENIILCKPCTLELSAACKFKQKCLDTEELIQDYVESQTQPPPFNLLSVVSFRDMRCQSQDEETAPKSTPILLNGLEFFPASNFTNEVVELDEDTTETILYGEIVKPEVITDYNVESVSGEYESSFVHVKDENRDFADDELKEECENDLNINPIATGLTPNCFSNRIEDGGLDKDGRSTSAGTSGVKLTPHMDNLAQRDGISLTGRKTSHSSSYAKNNTVVQKSKNLVYLRVCPAIGLNLTDSTLQKTMCVPKATQSMTANETNGMSQLGLKRVNLTQILKSLGYHREKKNRGIGKRMAKDCTAVFKKSAALAENRVKVTHRAEQSYADDVRELTEYRAEALSPEINWVNLTTKPAALARIDGTSKTLAQKPNILRKSSGEASISLEEAPVYNTKIHTCTLCGLTFPLWRDLNHHRLLHRQVMYKCKICKIRFTNGDRLQNHLETCIKQPYVRKFLNIPCSFCDYIAPSNSRLKVHMRSHTGERPYHCNICSYSGTQKISLNQHMRTHTGETPYACDLCEYSASRMHHLKRHLMSHSGEKPFKCEECEYMCNDKQKLKQHVRSHTGEKPYVCHKCGYNTSQRGNLHKHMKTHTGETQYKCTECSYEGKYKDKLVRHMRTHTGEKPFQCGECEYSAAQKVTLQFHVQSHLLLRK